jgi:hypothetical protein
LDIKLGRRIKMSNFIFYRLIQIGLGLLGVIWSFKGNKIALYWCIGWIILQLIQLIEKYEPEALSRYYPNKTIWVIIVYLLLLLGVTYVIFESSILSLF